MIACICGVMDHIHELLQVGLCDGLSFVIIEDIQANLWTVKNYVRVRDDI